MSGRFKKKSASAAVVSLKDLTLNQAVQITVRCLVYGKIFWTTGTPGILK